MSIDSLCKKYPDVPRSIVTKTDVIRLGVWFTQTALSLAKDLNIQFKGYFLFSQDIGHEATMKEKIPNFIIFKEDDTIIQTRVNPKSPYFVDWKDDKFMLCDETGPVREVYFLPAPKWLTKTLEDGTPLQAIAQPVGFDNISVCFDFFCEYWATNEQCLFCDIGSHLRKKKKLEDKVIARQKKDQVAQTLALAFEEKGFRHGVYTSGSIIKEPRDGKSETEWFCDYLNAIREKAGTNLQPAWFQIGAKPKDEVKMLHDTGIAVLLMNLEVWDERLFNILCPGKSRTVGRDTWIRRMFDAVDIFGRGYIMSNFVIGVEMAQPFGFKTTKEAIKSTLGGFEYLMQHDVLPKLDMWAIEPGSRLSDQQPPPLEYYIELERSFTELRHKYNFTFPYRVLCRGCVTHNLVADWEYFSKENSLKPA